MSEHVPEVNPAVLWSCELILSTMSLVGASFVLITCLLIKGLRKHPTTLIVYLSLCNFCVSIKYMIAGVYGLIYGSCAGGNEALCLFQAYWGQFWGMGSISWSFIISLNLIVSMTKPFYNTSQLVKFYHLFVWGVSFVSTVMLRLSNTKIGTSGDGTCWIENPKDPMRLIFYAPLLLYFLLSIVAVVTARVRVNTMIALTKSKKAQAIRRLVFYVAVFIVCWTGPISHKIAPFFITLGPTLHPTIFVLFDGIGQSCQGFANSLVWLSNPKFFTRFKFVLMFTVLRCFVDESRLPLIEKEVGSSDGTLQHTKYGSSDETDIFTSPLTLPQQIQISSQNQKSSKILGPSTLNTPLNVSSAEHWIASLEEALRESAILCFVLGIRKSALANVKSDSSLSKEYFGEVTFYSKDQLDSPYPIEVEFIFIDYFPRVFAKIRSYDRISAKDYMNSWDVTTFLSICRSNMKKFSNGKSGSFFAFSSDKRFIMKSMSEDEFTVLKNILPQLYQHYSQHKNSLISRIVGAHALCTRGTSDNKLYIMVIENVFYGAQSIHETYDIKGSWINRSGEGGGMGKDNDFDANRRKLNFPDKFKKVFLDQIVLDVQFLSSLGIMDYSLLVGFHFKDISNGTPTPSPSPAPSPMSISALSLENFEDKFYVLDLRRGVRSIDKTELYHFGLIDILQMYDIKKKTEVFYKTRVLLKEKEGISAAPPEFYCDRFIHRIHAITTTDHTLTVAHNSSSSSNNNNNNNNSTHYSGY